MRSMATRITSFTLAALCGCGAGGGMAGLGGMEGLQKATLKMQQGDYVGAQPAMEEWCADSSHEAQCAGLLPMIRMKADEQRAHDAGKRGDFKGAAKAQRAYCDAMDKNSNYRSIVPDCEKTRDWYEAKARGEDPPKPATIALGGYGQMPAPATGIPPAATPGVAPTAPPSPGRFVAASPQLSAYALVIGIEKYRDAPAATGARADAARFESLARTTLGISDAHLRVAVDDRATKSDLEGHLAWLKSTAPAGSRVYLYFSGHGAPDTSGGNGSPYLFPYDGNPKTVSSSAIALSSVMASLGQSRAKEVLVVLDSCFSGAGGRSVLPPGARPLMRVRDEAPAAQVALFTAASASEISGPAPGEALGLFTKYVTDGLGTGAADVDGDGQISLQELADWVKPRVARDAKKDNREQTPTVTVGNNVGSASTFSVAWGFPTK